MDNIYVLISIAAFKKVLQNLKMLSWWLSKSVSFVILGDSDHFGKLLHCFEHLDLRSTVIVIVFSLLLLPTLTVCLQ